MRRLAGSLRLARLAAALTLAAALGLLPGLAAAAPPLPLPATAAATAADPQRQSAVVEQAFDLLMDRFVRPLDSASLLQAAWSSLAAEAAQRNVVAPGPAPALTGDRAADVSAIRAALTAYFSTVPPSSDDWMPAYAAIRGMVTAADEGHTYFLDPRQYQDHLAWSRGDVKYSGIGARMKGPPLTVTEVFAGSPAQQAGLRAGDVILTVDGQDITGVPLDQTVALVRGPDGTVVQLTIQRSGEPGPLTLKIQRREVSLAFVQARMVGDGIGYLQLRGFPDTSVAAEFERDVERLQAQGAEALVVDLRGNSGGRLDVGNRLLSHFVPPGTNLYQQVDRGGNQQTRSSRQNTTYHLPVAVLVDEGTASMGEIFASALQENGIATVVGTTTSGNVAAAEVFPLDDGSALQVTVMEIKSGAGKQLNGIGVVPDEVVSVDPSTLGPGEDPVLDRAVAVLAGTLSVSRAAAVQALALTAG